MLIVAEKFKKAFLNNFQTVELRNVFVLSFCVKNRQKTFKKLF